MAALPTRESVKCELLAQTIRCHGMARLRVLGTSMLPSLWPGEIVEVRRRAPAEVEPGAVVLYARDGRLFAHRVVKKEEVEGRVCLRARGDRLHRPDPPVYPEELLGEVTHVERARRRVALPRRAAPGTWLLRLLSRFADWPAGLLLRLRGWRFPSHPPAEFLLEPDSAA